MKKIFSFQISTRTVDTVSSSRGFIFGFCGTHVSDLGGIICRTPGRCRRHRKKGSPLGGRKFEIYHFTNKIVVLPHYSMFLGQICVYKYLGQQENNIFTFIKSSRHGTLIFTISMCE